MKRQHRGTQPVNDDLGTRRLILGHREILKNASAFTCNCCRQDKTSGDAEGVHVYKTDDPVLQRAMGSRVGTYVLCIACVDSLSDDAIHEKVTAEFVKAGLFGRRMVVTSRTKYNRRSKELDRDRWELERLRAEGVELISHLDRNNEALIAVLHRLQEENQRLREQIGALKSARTKE